MGEHLYGNWGLSKYFLQHRHRYVRSLLHNSVNLDVGCCDRKITPESLGVDIMPTSATDRVCSVLALPFDDSTFDSCTMLEVIEHMTPQEQYRAVCEIKRVLKKDGQFILSMPDPTWGLFGFLWFFWERTGGRMWAGEHVGGQSREQLEGLLLSCGFTIVSSKRVALLNRTVEARA